MEINCNGNKYLKKMNNYSGNNTYSGNNRRFNNRNNSLRSYFGNFGNRNGNLGDGNVSSNYSGNGKQPQNGNYYSGNARGNYWNGNTNYKSSISPECQICSRRGHIASNCYYRVDNNNGQSSGGFVVCQICEKMGHIALECYHRTNFAYQCTSLSSSLTAMIAHGNVVQQDASASNGHGFSATDTWIMDTSATHHMTTNVNTLNQATTYNGDEKIIVGNG